MEGEQTMTLGQFEHELHRRLGEVIDQDDLRSVPINDIDRRVKEAVNSMGLAVPARVRTRLEYSYPPLRSAIVTCLSLDLPLPHDPFRGEEGAGHQGGDHGGEHRHPHEHEFHGAEAGGPHGHEVHVGHQHEGHGHGG